MLRTQVMNVSDRILPESSDSQKRRKEFYEIGNRTKSNLPLQIALYTNVWLFPAWLLVLIVSIDSKYNDLSDVYKILTVTVFPVVSALEGVRLYLGYLGNLAGKIPELASFWLISALIQFPLEAFLLFDRVTLPPFAETIVNSLMIFLLLTEIMTATVALRSLADHRAKRFYLAQLYGIEDNANNPRS